eukprot:579852-Rhodomonas_salina.1
MGGSRSSCSASSAHHPLGSLALRIRTQHLVKQKELRGARSIHKAAMRLKPISPGPSNYFESTPKLVKNLFRGVEIVFQFVKLNSLPLFPFCRITIRCCCRVAREEERQSVSNQGAWGDSFVREDRGFVVAVHFKGFHCSPFLSLIFENGMASIDAAKEDAKIREYEKAEKTSEEVDSKQSDEPYDSQLDLAVALGCFALSLFVYGELRCQPACNAVPGTDLGSGAVSLHALSACPRRRLRRANRSSVPAGSGAPSW